jgi:hypothetical protein
MIKINKFFKFSILTVLLIGFLTVAVHGQENFKPVADEMIGSSGISWVPKVNYSQLELTISRPDGTVFSKTFNSGSSLYASLSEIFGDSYLDGSYNYELRVTPVLDKTSRSVKVDRNSGKSHEALTQSGAFFIQGGAIVNNDIIEPGVDVSPISGAQEGLSGVQDIQHLDDVIISFSLCVGTDCVNGESFGFDTIRLKENNLRIHFDDTSNSASFPNNDWRITINDTSNGGASYFRIDDATNSKSPFTIEANAPSHSLYVDDGGRIGFGTSTPVVELHVKDGDTPTLRLEQDGSSGFTPQTWDVAGNETNFFVRDVTNGSKLPFKIRPGADHNSLVIDSDNDVGVGTLSPDFAFEVSRTNTGAQMVATRTDGAQMEFSASGSFGIAGTRTNHPVKFRVNLTDVMQLNATGNYIEMQLGGGYYDGNWVNGSSRELKENIIDLTTDDALQALEGLNPVRYNYKNNKEEEHVGFIAEDVPQLVAMKKRDGLTSMDFVAVLTKVVQEQQKTISKMEERIAQLEKDSK